MRKITLTMLIFLALVFGITGCVNKNNNKTFLATIMAIHDNTIIVEPFEYSLERKTSDRFTFEKLNDTEYRLGEILKIEYNGEIKEVYPVLIRPTKIFSMDLGDFNVTDKSDIKLSDDKITLTIKKNSLTSNGATIKLKNNSKKKISYGVPYSIEVNKDNGWYKIGVDLNFTTQALYLEPGKSVEINVEWKNGYGVLPTGKYRIIKNIVYEKTKEKVDVGVEFTID